MIGSRMCDSSGHQRRFGWVSPAEYLEALESIWSLLAGEVDSNQYVFLFDLLVTRNQSIKRRER